MNKKLGKDARILLGVTVAAVCVIVIGAFFAPAQVDTDHTPSTFNSGSAGAKAAYLLLNRLGYRTERLDESAAALDHVDAPHATLILAEAPSLDYRKEKPPIADFLRLGGHVLATGESSAAMLPDSHIAQPNGLHTALCYTTPQGLSPLARAGRVAIEVPMRWSSNDATTRIDQLCGDDAVVIHYAVGKGEVIWWSSPLPLSNRGLREDPSLKLLLASVGPPGSLVIFDEYIHGARPDLWATASGTPVAAMGWQLAGVAILLVLSFGRRNGPLRALVSSPRTSPLEFAESMGDLYRKAGAVDVVTGCAERRLLHFLETQGGIPRERLRSAPEAIAATVAERFRYRGTGLAEDIKAAREAEFAKLAPKSALALVKRLDHHIANLTGLMKHSKSENPHGELRD
ncbi:hypothetical protein HNQ77_002996 [Silvibacterium bohemicum]|uniref:DUF4350 domain-containing protein n=1 Tax=Silvibacterium bohemicum TaxID=1577686 RepID=A0A841JV57_9BACT|nr:DUF4350 domain-containing protein [Silvibacterium bohemicum]MBB6145040.1 hypothetical protein [Silvibacterium bohemicum]